MGIYTYGVTNQSRKIKGWDQPVYSIKFLGKDTFSTSAPGHRLQRLKSRYNNKPSMHGQLVAHDLFDGDQYITIYQYKLVSNTFTDGAIDYPKCVMTIMGYAKLVGKRYVKITVMEYMTATQTRTPPRMAVPQSERT